jgi:antitoxin PrlF
MQPTIEDETEDDPVVMQLFLDFITTEALKSNTLQPYTIEQSAIAHSLMAGVSMDVFSRPRYP